MLDVYGTWGHLPHWKSGSTKVVTCHVGAPGDASPNYFAVALFLRESECDTAHNFSQFKRNGKVPPKRLDFSCSKTTKNAPSRKAWDSSTSTGVSFFYFAKSHGTTIQSLDLWFPSKSRESSIPAPVFFCLTKRHGTKGPICGSVRSPAAIWIFRLLITSAFLSFAQRKARSRDMPSALALATHSSADLLKGQRAGHLESYFLRAMTLFEAGLKALGTLGLSFFEGTYPF